jgi:hypothetical protein
MATNVKDYGAVGDGVTDDSVAINAAINATFPRGTVVFPEAPYLINSPILVSGPGTGASIELVGEGATGQASELRAGPGLSDSSMITFVDHDCGVRNLFFNAGTATNATALEFQGDNNNGREYVKDCTFTSWTNANIFRTDSYTVSGCYAVQCENFIVGANWAMNGSIFDNYTLGSRRSVWLRQDRASSTPQQPEGVRITNNTFLPAVDEGVGIYIECGLEILIQGNIIDQARLNSTGINLKPARVGDVIACVKVLDNWIDAGTGKVGACVVADSSLPGTSVNRVWVERNTFVGGGSEKMAKPSVHFNLVQFYWLINNCSLVPKSVASLLLYRCFDGIVQGNIPKEPPLRRLLGW